MISHLEIANYKSIKALTLEMTPFMVFVGPNGAGKTNFVRAIELFGQLLSRGNTDPVREHGWSQVVHREKKPARSGLRLGATIKLPRRRGRSSTPTVHLAFTLRGKVGEDKVSVIKEELLVQSQTSRVALQRDEQHWQTEWGDDPELWSLLMRPFHFPDLPRKEDIKEWFERFERLELFQEDPSEFHLLGRMVGQVYQEVMRVLGITRLRLDASALRSDARFQADGNHALGPSGEGLPVAVDRLRGRGEEPADEFRPILTALQEVYPRIEDVVPEPFGQGRVTLGFRERGIAEPIPLDGVSDGVLHALALLVALSAGGPGLLAIEEPENAIHPWSVRKIVQRAQTRTGNAPQVLLTTHSETVVNAVADPSTLYIVEGDETHGTTITVATSRETALKSIIEESGQKLGDIWIDGSLGGVPLS